MSAVTSRAFDVNAWVGSNFYVLDSEIVEGETVSDGTRLSFWYRYSGTITRSPTDIARHTGRVRFEGAR